MSLRRVGSWHPPLSPSRDPVRPLPTTPFHTPPGEFNTLLRVLEEDITLLRGAIQLTGKVGSDIRPFLTRAPGLSILGAETIREVKETQVRLNRMMTALQHMAEYAREQGASEAPREP